ncbi:MAG: hypothetical protein ACXVHX_02230 [Solirubrobacteraceae bacterium]
MSLARELRLEIGMSLFLAVAAASSAPWWWQYMPWERHEALPAGVIGLSGGCDGFQVFAQNRFDPVGATERAAPNITSKRVDKFSPNYSITVDGWVHSRPAYPTNPAPWNSDVWFHVADDSGWVDFAAVRAVPTGPDPTDRAADGGKPAATSLRCEGSVQ